MTLTCVSLCFFIIVNLMTEIQGASVEPLTMVMGPNGVPIMISMQNMKQPSYGQRAMIFTGYYQPKKNSNQRVPFDSNLVNSDNDSLANVNPGPENVNDQFDKPEASSSVDPMIQEETTIQSTPDDLLLTTQIPLVQREKSPAINPEGKSRKSSNGKKTVVVKEEETDQDNEEENEEEDDEDDDDEDDELSPIVPFKGPSKRRNNNLPNLNNIFPMIFRFPKSYGKNSHGESLPELITAIANSYSTGKGGVASSVATAYGGPSNGSKKKQSKLSN
ncbi:uncharacterized protein LOC122855598 isoform X2 [Aphidius gifuensis]|uniref:uncharacterized protein LOC122855598 isoform X2 n=1 Tax=Aphidius gifuensis TaxID=684658 RepID=UPI001CDD8E5E|nr:uncharacterized protein LOC122855598 isoform X2 [Aphidius gifuensis]